MQTNPAAEHSKIIRWSENPWNQSTQQCCSIQWCTQCRVSLTRWTRCSLLVCRKFGRGQHRYTLLRRGIKVHVDAGQLLSTVAW